MLGMQTLPSHKQKTDDGNEFETFLAESAAPSDWDAVLLATHDNLPDQGKKRSVDVAGCLHC